MVLLILTWRRGTGILVPKTRRTEVPLDTLFRSLEKKPPHIVPGTAVFLTSDPEFAPTALLHNLKHNKVLHEHNVILTIVTADTPRVPEEDRVQIKKVSPRFSRVALRFGYMETPNVPKALAIARKQGWHFDIMSTSFFLSRRALKPAAAFRHAALAGPAVHRAGALGQRRHRLLPDPDRARGGGRHAGAVFPAPPPLFGGAGAAAHGRTIFGELSPEEVAKGIPKAASSWSTCASPMRPRSSAIRRGL